MARTQTLQNIFLSKIIKTIRVVETQPNQEAIQKSGVDVKKRFMIVFSPFPLPKDGSMDKQYNEYKKMIVNDVLSYIGSLPEEQLNNLDDKQIRDYLKDKYGILD